MIIFLYAITKLTQLLLTINRMLQRDPKQRLSVGEVLQNSFINYHARV